MALPPTFEGVPAGAHVEIAPTSHRNGAATLSVVCAALWPASVLVPMLISAVTGSQALPQAYAFFNSACFTFAPVVGIVAGHIGLYRSIKRPGLRDSRGWAIAGLAVSYLWFVGIFFLSFAGLELVYWITHTL